jgi:predicted small secreted protein
MESHMSRKITSPLIGFAALIGATSLAACNTVEGVGEDVQQAGEAVDEAAEEANDGNPNTP